MYRINVIDLSISTPCTPASGGNPALPCPPLEGVGGGNTSNKKNLTFSFSPKNIAQDGSVWHQARFLWARITKINYSQFPFSSVVRRLSFVCWGSDQMNLPLGSAETQAGSFSTKNILVRAKYVFLLIIFFIQGLQAQPNTTLKGIVKDKKEQPIFAANVYLKATPSKGVVTDLDGQFEIQVLNQEDTLVISFIGYEAVELPLSETDITIPLQLSLNESSQLFDEVVITAKAPISEQYAVTKLEKLDIYLNPASQGDPLKAITTLPASYH